jgi:hypothetical protein
MNAHGERKPFWKRKRWMAAAALWLLLAYPLSCGPLNYAAQRGWLPDWSYPVTDVLYAPLNQLNARHSWIAERAGFHAYLLWWIGLGRRHAVPDEGAM